MVNDGREPPNAAPLRNGLETRDDAALPRRRTPLSSIEQALRRFHGEASAYFGAAGDLDRVHDAIRRLADAGRENGAQPEELVVMLKHRSAVLASSKPHDPGEDERVKEQFVTWLIEAFFGGRAD